jgi:hypothetical protein
MTGLLPGSLDYMCRLAAAWQAASLQLVGVVSAFLEEP